MRLKNFQRMFIKDTPQKLVLSEVHAVFVSWVILGLLTCNLFGFIYEKG